MVVFTCNNCGDALQKPKVAKHYQFQCYNPIFVTCVDCLKDFFGNEYSIHTKCITESERYGGKNYVPSKSINKGEKKQEAWINIVQNILNNCTNLTIPERNILNSISKYENIPRKKPKFMNFIRNVSSNRVNMTIAENVWNKMESAFKEITMNTNKTNNENQKNQSKFSIYQQNDNKELIHLRNEFKEVEHKKIKNLKRLLKPDKNENCEQTNKKRKYINTVYKSQEFNSQNNNFVKFSWKSAIFDVLIAKGEISLKKLKKKVITQYLSNFPDTAAQKAASKFEKKILKISNILIVENKVKLLLD